MKKLTIVVLVAMLLLTAALPANAAIKATSVEIRGTVAIGPGYHTWNNASFAGFFYDIDDGLGLENLTAILTGDRTIGEDNLTYTTAGQPKMLKVIDAKYRNNTAGAITAGLEEFGAGDSAHDAGDFTIIGWMAEKYVAIKQKPNKLGKLLVEHGTSSSEKKTMTVGETWELGGGYSVTANSIDAKASPRQVWLTLSKDGVKKDDKVVTSGGDTSKPIYTYVEKSLCGETDVPIFVTYVDSIFAGATTDMVQFRYTWLMNPSCTEVKSSDVFGSMKVTSTDPLTLKNSDTSMTLSRDSTVDVMGGIKFRVADSDTLRYYPMVEYLIEVGPGPTPGNETPSSTVTTPKPTTNVTVTTPPGEETVAPPVTANATATKTETPGFEALFAIAGLLAVAFLVLRQRK